MKKWITLIVLTTFLLPAFGQKIDYDHDSKWYFGFNVGGTWNTTDVKNKTNLGWGLILGRQFNYNYGKVFSYDLRLRYLGGNWYGQDYDTTNVFGNGAYKTDGNAYKYYGDTATQLGYTVNNFNTEAHELGLELAIHLNNLRDKTGFDPYIFGGVGAVWSQTRGDLYYRDTEMADSLPPSAVGSDIPYDYSTNGISKSEWNSISDGVYDARLDGKEGNVYKLSIVPSVGIGLAYQVGPKFSIGIEHRTMFYLQNNFDGYNGSATKWGMANDIYHYTSLGFKFHIGKKETATNLDDNTNTNSNTNNLTNTGCKNPEITLKRPTKRNASVDTQDFTVETIIKEVSGRNNIQFSINGSMSTNFEYNVANGQFKGQVLLQNGVNEIVIKATNGCGSTNEVINITYQDCVPPSVNITSPVNGISTEARNATVEAQIQGANTITYIVNGVTTSNYMMNGNMLSSSVVLQEGVNSVQIVVKNECGEASDQIQITHQGCQKPLLSFIEPSGNFTTSNRSQDIVVQLQNVTSANQIQLKVNGVIRAGGTYNPSSGRYTNTVSLVEGVNTISVAATNDCGTDQISVQVTNSPCEGPKIIMVNPSTQSSSVESGTLDFSANVLGVNSASQIKLFLNGIAILGGTYNAAAKKFKKQLSLREGANQIKLTATNDCSSAELVYSITYSSCDEPTVSIMSPVGGETEDAQVMLKAKVKNVDGVSQIKLTLNGTTVTGGTYNAVTGIFQKMLSLSNGVNTIKVVATTDCGQTMGQVIVTKKEERKITICHYPPGNTDNPQQIEIPLSAWPAHQAHGDKIGPCPVDTDDEVEEKMVICHHPPGNPENTQQLEIPLSAWPAHQAHGDTQGPCPIESDTDDEPEEKIVICHHPPGNPDNTKQLTIPVSAWPAHQAHGDTQGPCPEESDNDDEVEQKITICHIPPGNPDNPHQLEIPLSAWPAHQAHGDKIGPCPVQTNDNGGEEEQKITICHHPPGNPDNTQQLEIPLSAWPAHQKHGDKLGPCPVQNDGGNNSGSDVNQEQSTGSGVGIGGSGGFNGQVNDGNDTNNSDTNTNEDPSSGSGISIGGSGGFNGTVEDGNDKSGGSESGSEGTRGVEEVNPNKNTPKIGDKNKDKDGGKENDDDGGK